MRLVSLVAAAIILCLSRPSFAQEWLEYVSRTDFFTVIFDVTMDRALHYLFVGTEE